MGGPIAKEMRVGGWVERKTTGKPHAKQNKARGGFDGNLGEMAKRALAPC